jgi:hypothetical protein
MMFKTNGGCASEAVVETGSTVQETVRRSSHQDHSSFSHHCEAPINTPTVPEHITFGR